VAKPNYALVKRQSNVAKKQQKEAKRQRKASTAAEPPQADTPKLPVDDA
jgi:hypothetical protein